MSNTSLVADYYNENAAHEHSRLIDRHLEYSVTMNVVHDVISQFSEEEFLKIADIGGGTGRYAVELARLGHKVTLSDISSSELAIAKQHAEKENVQLDAVIQGDARDLSTTFPPFQTEKFDLILLLGPLYHLLEESERVQAIQDCVTMTKYGGFIICAFVTKIAHLRDLAQKDPGRLLREKEFYDGYLRSGRYTRNPAVVSHHTHPVEIKQMFDRVEGVELLKMVGCEGFLGGDLARKLNELGESAYKAWVDVVMSMADDPQVLGASDHIIVVAKRTTS